MAEAGIGFDGSSAALSEMVERVAALPLAVRVVEQVSGTSLDAFFRDQIFAPLGMSETGFSVSDAALGRFATL